MMQLNTAFAIPALIAVLIITLLMLRDVYTRLEKLEALAVALQAAVHKHSQKESPK